MPTRIRDLPPDDRPRERLSRLGSASLSVAELLAVLLGAGHAKGPCALGLARELLAAYARGAEPNPNPDPNPEPEPNPDPDHCTGVLARLAAASVADLCHLGGVGPAKASRIAAAMELGRRAHGAKTSKPAIRSPQDVADLFGGRLRRQDREHFMAVLVDTKNQVLSSELVSVGSLDASLVHPREIFKAAVRHSAASVILLHNHPSGDPTPSEADLACTRRLVEAGRVLGIAILDHVIIGDGRHVSCRERGIGGL